MCALGLPKEGGSQHRAHSRTTTVGPLRTDVGTQEEEREGDRRDEHIQQEGDHRLSSQRRAFTSCFLLADGGLCH